MDELIEVQSEVERAKISALPRISGYLIVFFLLWPFGSMLNALRRFREPYARTVFWLFCVYFGFVFIYANPFSQGGADSARDAKLLIDMHNKPGSFDNLVSMLYTAKNGFTDVYHPLVTWLVALFTNNPHILYIIFAAVFGFFYAQNLWIIFSRINIKVGFTLFLFMLANAMINPITQINGVRWYTATHIFLYGILIYFLDGKKKGLIWSILSILVHFSFMFPVAILFIYLFLPHNLLIFFVFFIAASFVREVNLTAVRESLTFLPDFLQPKVESYTNEIYASERAAKIQELSWHVQFSAWADHLITYIWVIVAFFNRKKWVSYLPNVANVFGFALFFGGFAQVASLIPSVGRFFTAINLLFYPVFLLFLVYFQNYRKLSLFKIATIPLISFVIIFKIRYGLDYVGILTFLGNPVLALFSNEQVPLIDLAKQLFN